MNILCIRKIDLRLVDLIIEMAHKSTNTFRFSDVVGEPLQRLAPLRGFDNEPLVSFEKATEPLIGHVKEIEHMVYNIQHSNIQAKNGLTIDESSSIALYSMEWSPREQSFYMILNETLRNPEREQFLLPWLKFLRLFFTGSFETSIDWSSNYFSWSKNRFTKSI